MTVEHQEELTDKQWDKIKFLLPRQKPKTERPNNLHCTIINGMKLDFKNWRARGYNKL